MIFVSFLVLIATHIFVTRVKKEAKNYQLVLIKIIASLDLLILLAVIFLKFNFSEIIYVFFSFNLFSYSYFHFFNMSETARRIKILVSIAKNEPLNETYSSAQMLDLRIERLEKMGEINKIGDKYFLKRKTLFLISKLMNFLKKLFYSR